MKTHRGGARTRHDQGQEGDPGGGEAEIQTPPGPQRLLERSGNEDPIIEQHRQRRAGHDFFAAHPQQASRYGQGWPKPSARRFERADGAVQGQQIEQAHEGLRPLAEIGDGDDVKGMYDPQERHGRGQGQGCGAEMLRQLPGPEGSAHQAEQRQRRQYVDEKVGHVESARQEGLTVAQWSPHAILERLGVGHRLPAEDVIDRESQADDGPAGDGRVLWRPHRGPGGPEGFERWIVHDGSEIVQDEASLEAVGVGQQSRRHDQRHQTEQRESPLGRLAVRQGRGTGSADPGSCPQVHVPGIHCAVHRLICNLPQPVPASERPIQSWRLASAGPSIHPLVARRASIGGLASTPHRADGVTRLLPSNWTALVSLR